MEKNDIRLSSVILADDDFDDKDIFCAIVREMFPNVEIHTVNSGKELVEALNIIKADLLFLDINMFPVDGIEALRILKGKEEFKNLPVVMFSSTGRPDDVFKSYRFGANLFIRKSETFLELKALLKKALEMDWSHPERIRAAFYDTCLAAT